MKQCFTLHFSWFQVTETFLTFELMIGVELNSVTAVDLLIYIQKHITVINAREFGRETNRKKMENWEQQKLGDWIPILWTLGTGSCCCEPKFNYEGCHILIFVFLEWLSQLYDHNVSWNELYLQLLLHSCPQPAVFVFASNCAMIVQWYFFLMESTELYEWWLAF